MKTHRPNFKWRSKVMKTRSGQEFLLQFSLDFVLQVHVVASGQDKDTSEQKQSALKRANYTYTPQTHTYTHKETTTTELLQNVSTQTRMHTMVVRDLPGGEMRALLTCDLTLPLAKTQLVINLHLFSSRHARTHTHNYDKSA